MRMRVRHFGDEIKEKRQRTEGEALNGVIISHNRDSHHHRKKIWALSLSVDWFLVNLFELNGGIIGHRCLGVSNGNPKFIQLIVGISRIHGVLLGMR